MDLEILKKKISTFRGEGGRVRISDNHLLLEILQAWEQWSGRTNEFYRTIGVSQNGMASIIGKAKKLRREGQFPAEEFKEIKLENQGPGVATPCSGIELGLHDGRIIRFPQVDQLVEFLKKAA